MSNAPFENRCMRKRTHHFANDLVIGNQTPIVRGGLNLNDPKLTLSTHKLSTSGLKNRLGESKPAKIESVSKSNQK